MQMISQATPLWAVAIEHADDDPEPFRTSLGRVIGWTADGGADGTAVPLIVWFEGPAMWSSGSAVTPAEGLCDRHVLAYGETSRAAGTRARTMAHGLLGRWIQQAQAEKEAGRG